MSGLRPTMAGRYPEPATRSLCALLTCFNRREQTLACLRALNANTGLDGVALHAILVDDGSSDGTAQAVRAEFPWMQVLSVAASEKPLFWCRGMHRAFGVALEVGFDHYLWLNDDTMLVPDAIERLLATSRSLHDQRASPVIVVGSTTDAVTGVVSYGGERRVSRWRPFRIERLMPADRPQRCDSMTGNVVLIDRAAAHHVGNIDAAFEHSMGDTDYALRAWRCGVEVWLAAGTHGTCSDNSPQGKWVDRSQPLRVRWRDMMTRKGLPWRSWLLLTRRHAGWLWPLHFAMPYAKVLVQGILHPLLTHRR